MIGQPGQPKRLTLLDAMKLRRPQKWLRVIARMAVRRALARGELVKPDRCDECGSVLPERAIQAHHADYEKPLDVEWLCQGCHSRRR